MERNDTIRTRQDRGLSALIWCLAILLCIVIIAAVVIGTGYFKILQVRSAVNQSPRDQWAAPKATAPAPAPGIDAPSDGSSQAMPRTTREPLDRDKLPDLELDVQPSDEMRVFASIPDVVEAASDSVVGIIQYQKDPRTGKLVEYTSGSGFIVSENGYILTNAHMVMGAAAVDVLFNDGERRSALVVGADATTDIAVLKVEGENYPALPLGDSNALRVGEYVIAIGHPLSIYELYGTVTFGIISATAREINIDGYVNTYLQTDASINFGNSGGPLINMNGQVIGMTTAKSVSAGYDSRGNTISAEGIGFALPIQDVIDIANRILRDGGLVRPGIGVQVRTVDAETAASNNVPVGSYIESVTAGAPAEEAGLKAGDIITGVDAVTVVENDDVVNYIRSRQVGDVVAITVYRDGAYLTIDVTIGDINTFADR